MSKKLIEKRHLEDGSVICRSLKYADREELFDDKDDDDSDDDAKERREKVAVIVGLGKCQATPPIPEYSASFRSLTGRYEGPTCTVCLNHAGYHVRLWISEIPRHAGANRAATHYAGDYESETGRFKLYAPDAPDTTVGFLTHDGIHLPHLDLNPARESA